MLILLNKEILNIETSLELYIPSYPGSPRSLPARAHTSYLLGLEIEELSETSLELYIPSYPGSPRSLPARAHTSQDSNAIAGNTSLTSDISRAIEFLHEDEEFLQAAETGNDKILEILIRKGANIQQTDYLGRNALHLAVCANSLEALTLLLQAGVDPNVKDDIGMTPLYLSLMRNQSLRVVNLLFDHGAKILPRTSPMNTGLFIQFVMMCTPTPEEAKILRLLVNKGALVDDPDAPGGRQALHFAAMSNNCELIRILLKLRADLFLINHRHETPKEVAQSFRCKEAASLLAEFEEAIALKSPSSFVRGFIS